MRRVAIDLHRVTGLIRLLAVGGLIAGGAPAAGARDSAGCDVTRRPGCVAWAEHRTFAAPQGRNRGRAVANSADGTLIFVATAGTDLAYEAATGGLRWAPPTERAERSAPRTSR